MITLTGTYIQTVTLTGVMDGFVGLDPDVLTLIAAMNVEPDATRQTLIGDTIVALKDAGIWDELDECWFMAAHDAQAGLLGWKRYKDLTAVNAPTFTTDRGYAGNGTTSYLNTNYAPATDGVQFTLNDASMGAYSRTDNAGAWSDMGAFNAAGVNATSLSMKWSDNKQYTEMSAPGGANIAAANSLGLGVSRRIGATAVSSWRNGVSIATGAPASQALVSVALYIGAINNNSSAFRFSARQYAFAFVGASLSTGQQASLATILTSYLTAIGANV